MYFGGSTTKIHPHILSTTEIPKDPKIFISFSFRDADHELVGMVDQLVMSHQLTRETGRQLEDQPLTDEIRENITQADEK